MIQTLRFASARQILLAASLSCLTIASVSAQSEPSAKVDLVVESAYTYPTALAGTERHFQAVIKNLGTVASPQTSIAAFLSSDNKLDATDIRFYERAIDLIDAGAVYNLYENLYFPDNIQVGTYTLFVVVDYKQEIPETEEMNNAKALAFRIVSEPMPDWEVGDVEIAPYFVQAGDAVNIVTKFRSIGTADAPPVKTRIYLSENSVFDASDVLLRSGNMYSSLVPGGSGFSNNTGVRIPANTASGGYYVLSIFDPENLVEESDEQNNISRALITVGTITGLALDSGKDNVTVWPNPATDLINIEAGSISGDGKTAEVILYNILGKAVLTKKVRIQNNTLQATLVTQSLSSGMYQAHIRVGAKVIVKAVSISK